jgi:hypothetical protein
MKLMSLNGKIERNELNIKVISFKKNVEQIKESSKKFPARKCNIGT